MFDRLEFAVQGRKKLVAETSDKLKEALINLISAMSDLYREAVATSSPTLPLGGYVGYRTYEEDATPSGLRRIGIRYPG